MIEQNIMDFDFSTSGGVAAKIGYGAMQCTSNPSATGNGNGGRVCFPSSNFSASVVSFGSNA